MGPCPALAGNAHGKKKPGRRVKDFETQGMPEGSGKGMEEKPNAG